MAVLGYLTLLGSAGRATAAPVNRTILNSNARSWRNVSCCEKKCRGHDWLYHVLYHWYVGIGPVQLILPCGTRKVVVNYSG